MADTATVTTNITFPRDEWKALKIVAMEQGVSMAEFVRTNLKNVLHRTVKTLIRKKRLTINGFTPEFEEEVLRAEKEPVDRTKVWKTSKDIDDYFAALP